MLPQRSKAMCVFGVCLALIASTEAFFLKWGSDSTIVLGNGFACAMYLVPIILIFNVNNFRQASSQKAWQSLSPNMAPVSYRYQYTYPYDSRKYYQIQSQQYAQPEMPMQQSLAPIPISVPAGASLTPVSLQHVQLVPCMCPVAPEEAEKLQEQVGPGPYVAQTYQQSAYAAPQQMTVAADTTKTTTKQ